jgi:peptidoglycan-associated lipoprotein
MNTRLSIALVAGIALLVVSGCERIRSAGEAGRFLDEGRFGDPTMNNVLVMTGQRSYYEQLAERFAQEVPTTINFAFNSDDLDVTSQNVLRTQAAWIRQFPEVRFSVYGHTDLVGSDSFNYRLGLRRARAAVNFLVAQGIDRDRLDALVSLGETQPLVATPNRELRNRRTVTEVSGFVQGNQMVLDGNYANIVYRTYTGSAGGGE